MAAPTAAPPLTVRHRWPTVPPAVASLRPVWSKQAAYRAVRATLVVPGIFALTDRVIGDLQMATFAAFGGFATLVLASFTGSRLHKLEAHALLGVVGSLLLIIGTAVNSNTVLAALVTVPVVFCVLFGGITGPNASSGGTAALLAYVLPAASPGTLSMIPSRLEGWWLATGAGTLAVLLLSPRPESDRLRLAASDSAAALAVALEAAVSGKDPKPEVDAAFEAKHQLALVFGSTPSRPTGLARADQALDDLVESLEWSSLLVVDLGRERTDVGDASKANKELIDISADALRHIAGLLRGDRGQFDLSRFDKPIENDSAEIVSLGTEGPCTEREVHLSFHARMVASAVRMGVIQAQVACGIAERTEPTRLTSSLRTGAKRAMGHASLRSVWTLNSIRGAVALAAAVATADLVHVQHGFWVVLGALSVLRTTAASTGATALRAIVGTAVGFFIGAGLILAIGDNTSALWIALPIALFVAAYAPGTAPFAVGQAAFTVTITVLYNILVPVGWKVGVVRIEDVAIGAAVSAVVGILFWPRGATAIVAGDLADSFHIGGTYLVQATSWAVGSRSTRPDAGAQTAAVALRLDDAVRGLANEQGSKHVPKEFVWRLIAATLRLRLTCQSLASLPPPHVSDDPARHSLVGEAVQLAEQCDGIARQLRMTPDGSTQDVIPAFSDDPASVQPEVGYLLWVREHLDHVRERIADLVEPVDAVAARKSLPWWR